MTIEEETTLAAEATGDGAAAAATNPNDSTEGTGGQGQGDAVKGEGEQAAVEAGSAEGKGDTPVVPEAYTVPDGYTITESHMQFVSDVAKGAGLTQEQFNLAIPKWAEMREQERQFERGTWYEMSEAEFGKDFAPIVEGAKRGVKGAEALRPGITDRMEATNLGNHPDVLWLFNKLGELTRERPMDGLGNEASGQHSPRSLADRMFGI